MHFAAELKHYEKRLQELGTVKAALIDHETDLIEGLRADRKAFRISLRKFAKLTGLSASYYGKLERKEVMPGPSAVLAILKAFHRLEAAQNAGHTAPNPARKS